MTRFQIDNVLGMDIEKEDRDVGIFGNWFMLGFLDKNGQEITLELDDDRIDDLIRVLKPQIDEIRFQEEMDSVLENNELCCLCKKKIEGHGNNADPLVEGRCCDDCNTKVIKERIRRLKNGS